MTWTMVALLRVIRQGERYALTELGCQQASERLACMRQAASLARNLMQPETVSKVAVGAHLALAPLKLPAGLLSGSIDFYRAGLPFAALAQRGHRRRRSIDDR
jgi:hypothetical protein